MFVHNSDLSTVRFEPCLSHRGVVTHVSFPEHPSLCRLDSRLESYDCFSTAMRKPYTVTVKICNYIYKYKYVSYTFIYTLYTGISNRILTNVHICVVTKTEGRTPGNTAVTTSPQLRRSDRGGFPYDML